MNAAALANAAWAAWNRPAHLAYRGALRDPRRAQAAILRRHLRDNAETAFGREHHFAEIDSAAAFARRVPARDYDALAPYIDRIAGGEANVLTRDLVERLAVTSGSTRARKLIPQTRGLQREFGRAVGPWVVDLFRRDRSLLGGCAYWSITPPGPAAAQNPGGPPVGFDEDSAYLGGVAARLVDAAMAVPAAVRHVQPMEAFRYATLRHLLGRGDLRLISVWHPSFLGLLLDDAERWWGRLVEEVADPRRAAHLRRVRPANWSRVWTRLKVVSCWADAHAAGPAAALAERMPEVKIQPKGLLATEAFVSIPFAGRHPLAVRSHYLEFEEDGGRTRAAHELKPGGEYGVIVTTGGGLWRYRLGDRVRVDGFVGRTPSVRFVGRTDAVVDRFGEKLSEGFVGSALRREVAAAFAMLAPDGQAYTLYVSSDGDAALAERIDARLRENPHYAHCRALGQLGPVRLFRIERNAYATFAAALVEEGRRLGDIKATPLSERTDWSRRFVGRYEE